MKFFVVFGAAIFGVLLVCEALPPSHSRQPSRGDSRPGRPDRNQWSEEQRGPGQRKPQGQQQWQNNQQRWNDDRDDDHHHDDLSHDRYREDRRDERRGERPDERRRPNPPSPPPRQCGSPIERSKRGQCPRQDFRQGGRQCSGCRDTCTHDFDCEGQSICCSRPGCGNQCVRPVS